MEPEEPPTGNLQYYSGDDALDWAAAEDFCIDLGGHLVSVHSDEELEFLIDYVLEQDDDARVLIGFNDLDTAVRIHLLVVHVGARTAILQTTPPHTEACLYTRIHSPIHGHVDQLPRMTPRRVFHENLV